MVKGANGFVCMVQRSWTAGVDDPDFWNPKLRAPIRFNAQRHDRIFQSQSLKPSWCCQENRKLRCSTQFRRRSKEKELPTLEFGSVCYMMWKEGYLSDRDGHWHPHLMFFVPLTDAKAWAAGPPGSPIFAGEDALDRLTVFLVPVSKWSDGTADTEKN